MMAALAAGPIRPYGELGGDDRAGAASGPRFEMDGMDAGGDRQLCDIDVVGGFTANDGAGIVDGVAEGRGRNALASDVVRAYP